MLCPREQAKAIHRLNQLDDFTSFVAMLRERRTSQQAELVILDRDAEIHRAQGRCRELTEWLNMIDGVLKRIKTPPGSTGGLAEIG